MALSADAKAARGCLPEPACLLSSEEDLDGDPLAAPARQPHLAVPTLAHAGHLQKGCIKEGGYKYSKRLSFVKVSTGERYIFQDKFKS